MSDVPKTSATERVAAAAKSVAEAQAAQRRAEARVAYEAACIENKYFTRNFNTQLEAVIADTLCSNAQRVLAAIIRYSWGEYSLFAIKPDGHPMYQVDLVALLGIPKQRMSGTISYMEKRGHLEAAAKQLRPAIAPVLGPAPEKVADQKAYKAFVEEWKVANSSDFSRMEDAKKEYFSIKKVLLSDYRKYLKERTKPAATLLENQESNSETKRAAAVSPFEADQKRVADVKAPAKHPAKAGMQSKAQTQAAELLFSEIIRMQEAYPNSNFATPRLSREDPGDRGLVQRILTELGSDSEEYIVGFCIHCMAKFKGFGMGGSKMKSRAPGEETGPQGVGLLPFWAKDYARIAKPTPAEERRDAVDRTAVNRELDRQFRLDQAWEELGEAEQWQRIEQAKKLEKGDGAQAWRLLTADQRADRALVRARKELASELDNEVSGGAGGG